MGNITPTIKANFPIISKETSGKSSFSSNDYSGGDLEKFDKSLITVWNKLID